MCSEKRSLGARVLLLALSGVVVSVVVSVVLAVTGSVGWSQDASILDENGQFLRATPESQGVPSETIASLVQSLNDQISTMNSLMILRHGRVIAEAWWAPFTAEDPHAMYSLSKSFTSTAAGLASDEGRLDPDTPVLDFFPDDQPDNPSDNLKKMRVRDLLTMSCGHEHEPRCLALMDTSRSLETVEGVEDDWLKQFLNQPVVYEPGTHFCYNSVGTYMVGLIVAKQVGKSVPDYLQEKLFKPLRMEPSFWEVSPQGFCKGGSGLYLKTEDMAKFGQFYLQQGNWDGRQILSREWIEQATSKQVSNGTDPESDWAQGYGFQFWRCRHQIFRGDGACCQFIIVMPEQDMVIASTADSSHYQDILNLYWDILLPAIQEQAIPENEAGQTRLQNLISGLTVKEGVSGSQFRTAVPFRTSQKEKGTYSVYLPNAYRTTGYEYPVLCLIPEDTRPEEWGEEEKGDFRKIADECFQGHPRGKVIVALPDIPDTMKGDPDGWLATEFFPALGRAWRWNGEFRIVRLPGTDWSTLRDDLTRELKETAESVSK